MPTDADLQAMQAMVSASLQSCLRDLTKFHDKAKESAGPGGGFSQLSDLFGGLTKQLAGPVGLAAAIYAVARSLESFSTGRIQLQNLSTDIGLSTKLISAMGLAMDKAAIPAEAQAAAMAKLGNAVRDLAARGFGADIAKMFQETGVSANEIQKLIDASRRSIDEGTKATLELLNSGNEHLRGYRSERIGILESVLQAMNRWKEEMGKAYEADLKAAEFWNRSWVSIGQGLRNTWARIQDDAAKYLSGLNDQYGGKVKEGLDKVGGPEGFRANPKSIFGRMLDPDDKMRSSQWWMYGPGGSGADKPATFNERFGDFPAGAGGKARATDFGGMRRTDDLIRTEEDSNKALRDIRDTLLRMETGDDDTGSGGGTGSGGRTGGGGGGTGSGGDGGTGRGRRSIGGTRRRGGGLPEGSRDIGAKDSGGAAGGGAAGGGASQGEVGGGGGGAGYLKEARSQLAAQADQPETRRWLRGILSAENPGAGPAVIESLINRTMLVNEGRTAKDQAPVTLLDMMKGHKSIGGGKSFYGPVRTGAIYSHMARADHDSKYAASLDRSIDRAFQGSNTIEGHTDQGSVGDPNYIAGGVGVNINRERFNDWSYPGARAFRERLMAQYRRPSGMRASAGVIGERSDSDFMSNAQGDVTADRATIDRSVATQRLDGSLSASVDFKNMPSWVRSNVESNGKFKDLRVTRQTPQDGKAGVAWGDTNKWSYE